MEEKPLFPWSMYIKSTKRSNDAIWTEARNVEYDCRKIAETLVSGDPSFAQRCYRAWSGPCMPDGFSEKTMRVYSRITSSISCLGCSAERRGRIGMIIVTKQFCEYNKIPIDNLSRHLKRMEDAGMVWYYRGMAKYKNKPGTHPVVVLRAPVGVDLKKASKMYLVGNHIPMNSEHEAV